MDKYKKVVILDSVILYPEHRYRLNQIAEEIVEYNTCKDDAEVLERVQGADCIISCWVDVSNAVIDANPQLRTVAFWTHAYEHRINKEYAISKGIYVPCIPDYGTDSVAELAFIGLLHLYEKMSRRKQRGMDEQILQLVSNDVRKFVSNVKKNLTGSWMHEYIKSGQLKIMDPEDFKEDTMKGLTVGFLVKADVLNNDIVKMFTEGFKMNAIHSCCDVVYDIDIAFRPVDQLLNESQILIYDSKMIEPSVLKKVKSGSYLSVIDINDITPRGDSIKGIQLGIIGLGRIGTRVAQIARCAFDMNVSYYSKTRKPEIEEKYGITYKPLDKVLCESEVISFHLPHVGAEGFITNEMIDRIPMGTTVLNVSVGNIFKDQDYIFNRFKENDLIGYVDVYSTLPPRQLLRERKEYLLSTYRLGWRTKSTVGLKSHKLITKLALGLKDE